MHEEIRELEHAAAEHDSQAVERELGDLLFALSNFARKQDIDPEAALRASLGRFSNRFSHAEQTASSEGRPLRERTPEELDQLWNEAKSAT